MDELKSECSRFRTFVNSLTFSPVVWLDLEPEAWDPDLDCKYRKKDAEKMHKATNRTRVIRHNSLMPIFFFSLRSCDMPSFDLQVQRAAAPAHPRAVLPSFPSLHTVRQPALLLQPHPGEGNYLWANRGWVPTWWAVLQGGWTVREPQRPVGPGLYDGSRLQPGVETAHQRRAVQHDLPLLLLGLL